MKRRSFLVGGAAAATGLAAVGYELLPPSVKMLAGNYRIFPGRIPLLVEHDFGWKGSDFLAGGTRQVHVASLPAPKFQDRPNCVATLANIIGPCDAHLFPHRADISEGRAGLPMRLSLRIVDAASCRPHAGAEIQIWHADPRGIYSGRKVSAECTFNDPIAISGLAFRGRQLTGPDGVANFITVYPGWYKAQRPYSYSSARRR